MRCEYGHNLRGEHGRFINSDVVELCDGLCDAGISVRAILKGILLDLKLLIYLIVVYYNYYYNYYYYYEYHLEPQCLYYLDNEGHCYRFSKLYVWSHNACSK